ncbi:MAG: EFR1 family ferrodoxin [Muribaculaceae bacterium]|nr:EFR1 family ferrodoxin [Muribaculaceae bacterium]
MIIYFSGTGNSRAVARRLSGNLGDKLYEISGKRATSPSEAEILTIESDAPERVVWVFPTYSWGVPPVVQRFMTEVRAKESFAKAQHWMVTTCGDDMGLADGMFRRLLRKRGWKTAEAAFSVIMPNTYTLMKGFDVDQRSIARTKLAAMPSTVDRIAAMIDGKEKAENMLVRGGFPWIKTKIVFPWFRKYEMSPKPFHYTAACTACGKCARSCPLDNIRMGSDGPEWGTDCALCLRCYHICPQHAVAYGKTTDGKGQYMFPEK